MADPANSAPSTGFFAELRRRRVLHIGGIYVAGAWLITEIASFLLEQAGAPVWAFRLLAIVFVVGFPVAVVLAWLIQVQPDGKWAVDSSKGHHRTVMAAIALGVAATAGLSWLILPRIEGTATAPSYQPIPNSVAILPLAVTVGTPNERSIAETLLVSLGRGLDQSADLILMDLRKLSEQPENPTEFGRSIKAAALLTGEILQAPGATRIRMDLLDVGQGEVTWSRTFDWDASRIGDTGTAIANDVLGTMTLPGSACCIPQYHGSGHGHGRISAGYRPRPRIRAGLRGAGGDHRVLPRVKKSRPGGASGAGRPRQAGAGDGPRARP
jgi:TolB-like protein